MDDKEEAGRGIKRMEEIKVFMNEEVEVINKDD